MEIRCITGGKCNICVSNFLSEMRDFVCVSRTNLCAYFREMLIGVICKIVLTDFHSYNQRQMMYSAI